MKKNRRFKLIVPVLGFVALAAVGLCVYLMQSRMDEMQARMNEFNGHKKAQASLDSVEQHTAQISEEDKENARNVTRISDDFCTYLDSLKNIYINNGGVASIPETSFSSRMQSTCQAMLRLVKDTAAKARLDMHQFCISSSPDQVRKALTHSPLAAVMMYLEKAETDCRDFETQVTSAIQEH